MNRMTNNANFKLSLQEVLEQKIFIKVLDYERNIVVCDLIHFLVP